MARKPAYSAKRESDGANLGFEHTLWAAADVLRGNLEASEFKHVVLGLIFLKYISDAFEEKHEQLSLDFANPSSASFVQEPAIRYEMLEDRDEYTAENVFWVPKEARWSFLKNSARQPDIGRLVDAAMTAVERENPKLKGMLPKDYARPSLDQRRLGELIDILSSIGLGGNEGRSKDLLGRVYEYFLSMFASREGKSGGEHYTPRCVVKLLVEMIEPYKGRVYDPCCGSAGMFVQNEEFIEEHGGRRNDIAIYGQESVHTTWRLARMNLVLRGIEANLGTHDADTFHQDLHPDLKADFILANPPFNDSNWGGERLRDDVRWKFGAPPPGNANFAWVQHIIHHLAQSGYGGFVLANGSLSSNTSGEGVIRRNIVEADLVDCIIALPPQLFYGTAIPACLWFIARNKANGKFRDRHGHTLFIDCRKLGELVDRTHRELTGGEIKRIAATYHAWRGEAGNTEYADIPGFCKSASIAEIAEHEFVLTPGRYVGAADAEEDSEPFAEKMQSLTARLEEQFAESHRLEEEIRANLRGLGFLNVKIIDTVTKTN